MASPELPGTPPSRNSVDGQLSLNSDGSFTYTPNAGYRGFDSFTYYDSDGYNCSNVATVTIVVNTSAPVASSQSYQVAENAALDTNAQGLSGVLSDATDGDNALLTAQLVAGPHEGSLTFNGDGSFVYTPNAGYLGGDSFSYEAYDGVQYSTPAVVSLTVANLPTAVSLSNSTLADDQPGGTAVGVLSTVDPNPGSSFSYTLVPGDGSGDNGSFTIVGNQLETNAVLDHATQPTYSVRIRGTDSVGLWVEDAFTISVQPSAPTNLAVTAIGSTQVSLSWQDNSGGQDAVIVEQMIDGGWQAIDEVAAGTTSDTIAGQGFEPSTSYSFCVQACDESSDSCSPPSNVATVTTAAWPAAPSGLTVTIASASEADLRWDSVPGASGYNIYQSTDDTTWALLATVGPAASQFSDTTTTGGTQYYYEVVAFNSIGASVPEATAGPVEWEPPVLRLDGPTTVQEGQDAVIQMSAAFEGSETVTDWQIDWGDENLDPVTSNSASHVYTSGTGTYDVSVTADTAEGPVDCPDTVSIGVLPAAPTGLSAEAVDGSGGQIDLSWTDNSQLATEDRIEQSTNGINYTLVDTIGAGAGEYTVDGLSASTTYSFRVCSIDDAGRSGYVTASGTTNDAPSGELPPNDDSYSDAVDIGMNLNFYGTRFNQVYVNNNGNINVSGGLSTYTPAAPLTTAYGAIIAPFFADVDTRIDQNGGTHGTVTYFSTSVGGRPAWEASWNNVDYYNVLSTDQDDSPNHIPLYDTFSVTLVDRSDVYQGDFDIVFDYGGLSWETGDASGGRYGMGGYPARAGYSDGSGDAGTYYELDGSGTSGGLLGLSGEYTYQIRNPVVGMTAYRTGDNHGEAVSQSDQQSGDPSNYVILVDDGYDQDPTGNQDNIDYNTGVIDQGGAVNVDNQNFARITLKALQSHRPSDDGTINVELSNPDSVRLFDANGHELTADDLTASINGGGYLSALASQNVDIYVEGLKADPDFTLSYCYVDEKGVEEARADVHMAVADISFVNDQGQTLNALFENEELSDLPTSEGVQTSLDGAAIVAEESLTWDEFRNEIAGLTPDQIRQATFSTGAGGSYNEDLTDSDGGTESSDAQILFDDAGQTLGGEQGALHSELALDCLAAPAAGQTAKVTVTTVGGDQFAESLPVGHAWSIPAGQTWTTANSNVVVAGGNAASLAELAVDITGNANDDTLITTATPVKENQAVDVSTILLRYEKNLRGNIVQATKDAKPGARFGKGSASALTGSGVDAVFAGGAVATDDCQAMAFICEARGLIETVALPGAGQNGLVDAEKEFDSIMGNAGNMLNYYTPTSSLSNLQEGDIAGFSNMPDYLQKSGGGDWQAENTIVVGDFVGNSGLYWGYDSNNGQSISFQGWMTLLAQKCYGPGATEAQVQSLIDNQNAKVASLLSQTPPQSPYAILNWTKIAMATFNYRSGGKSGAT